MVDPSSIKLRIPKRDRDDRSDLDDVGTPKATKVFTADDEAPTFPVTLLDILETPMADSSEDRAQRSLDGRVFGVPGSKVEAGANPKLFRRQIPLDVPVRAELRLGRESFEIVDPTNGAVVFEIPFFRVWAWSSESEHKLFLLHLDWPKEDDPKGGASRVYNAGLPTGRAESRSRALTMAMQTSDPKKVASAANRLSHALVGEKEALGVGELEMGALFDVVAEGKVDGVQRELRRMGFSKTLDATQACALLHRASRSGRSDEEQADLVASLFPFLSHAETLPIVLAELTSVEARNRACTKLHLDPTKAERHLDPGVRRSTQISTAPSTPPPPPGIRRRGESFLSNIRDVASRAFSKTSSTGSYARLDDSAARGGGIGNS